MAPATSESHPSHPWALPAEQLASALQTNPTAGLATPEADRRRQQYGPNQLQEEPPPSLLWMFLRQFADFMIGLLAVAAIVGAVVGDWEDSLLIGLIVLGNAVIGFFQEQRAAQAVAALKKLAEPSARVWRDGKLSTVPAVQLTLGDLVELKAGDLVPADARLVEVAELQAAEAPLTGESFPVEKSVVAVKESTALPERTSMVYAGTSITSGHGRAVVTAIGMSMELGKIAKLLGTAKSGPTPLEQRLTQLSKRLAVVVLGVCGLVFVVGLWSGTARNWEEMLLVAVSLAVAAIPEGLPAVITVALALGSQQMSRRKAIVRQLAAVETLGSVDVICSDKTGTLTQNEMEVAEIVTPGKAEGDDNASNRESLLRAGALSNDAQIAADGKVVGSATEKALIEAAEKVSLDVEALRKDWPRVGEFPFSSARKRMSTLHRQPNGGHVVFAKGAVESILERSVRQPGGSLDPAERDRILAKAVGLAGRGQRVLGIAERVLSDGELPKTADDAERDLTFLGFVSLVDPVRPEAKQAILNCRSAGIRPVMITGDHPETARSVAEELSILAPDELLLSGPELDALSDEELAQRAPRVGVYARVTPEHKLKIVRAHQSRGSVVSMTGDGVNDAPALKQADIGVAMGITGTDVSKEAARMVLADDNFATIVAAVEEGRVVYDNIRKFVRYLLTTNAGEIMLLLFAILLGWKVPLLPIHLLWINLVTDGLPALALGFEPAERGIMARPPRRRKESLFAEGMARDIVGMGLWMALASLGVFYWCSPEGGRAAEEADWSLARTMAFVTLSQFQLFYVLSLRSSVDPFWKVGWLSNYRLTGAILLGTILQLAVVYVPPLARMFHAQPLSANQLLVAFAVASTACVFAEIAKRLRRRAA